MATVKFILLNCFVIIAAMSAIDAINELDMLMEQQQNTLRALFRSFTAFTARSKPGAITTDMTESDLDDCFVYIQNKQLQNFANYRNQTNNCHKVSEASKKELTQQSNSKRESLLTVGNTTCGRLSECVPIADGLKFFLCYNNASSLGSKELRTVSESSSDEYTYLNMKTQQIDYDKSKCDADAYKSYQASSSDIDIEMQLCISGKFQTGNLTDSREQ